MYILFPVGYIYIFFIFVTTSMTNLWLQETACKTVHKNVRANIKHKKTPESLEMLAGRASIADPAQPPACSRASSVKQLQGGKVSECGGVGPSLGSRHSPMKTCSFGLLAVPAATCACWFGACPLWEESASITSAPSLLGGDGGRRSSLLLPPPFPKKGTDLYVLMWLKSVHG